MVEGEVNFQFAPLHSPVLGSFGKETPELLEKWGFGENLKFALFSYDKHFQSYLKESFTLDFFHSVDVNNVLQTVSSRGVFSPLLAAKEIDGVVVEDVSATVLNMAFFDRLEKSGAVRGSGRIVKCFDEMCGDMVVSDQLRKMLLMEDSENYDVFSKSDRDEFIFQLFRILQLGGRINQYEDDIKPYMDTCKHLYKELVTVVKDINTKALSVVSTVYRVQAKVKDDVIFPGRESPPHEQSFCYLILDNIKRTVNVLYHTWN